jgi:hypothetical protein
LFGVFDAVEDGADLGEDLGQVELADTGELLEKSGPGVGGDDAFDLCFELGDGVQQGAQELDLSSQEACQYLGWQPGGRGGCRAKSGQQFGGCLAAAVSVAAQEGGHASFTESSG